MQSGGSLSATDEACNRAHLDALRRNHAHSGALRCHQVPLEVHSGALGHKQAQAGVSAHHAARDSVNEKDHEGRFLEVAVAWLLNAHREEIAIDVPDEGRNQRSSEPSEGMHGGGCDFNCAIGGHQARSDILVEGGHQGDNQRGHQGGYPTYLWRTERSPSTRTGECTAASTG